MLDRDRDRDPDTTRFGQRRRQASLGPLSQVRDILDLAGISLLAFLGLESSSGTDWTW